MGNFIENLKVFFNVLSECQFTIESHETEKKVEHFETKEEETNNNYKINVDSDKTDLNRKSNNNISNINK